MAKRGYSRDSRPIVCSGDRVIVTRAGYPLGYRFGRQYGGRDTVQRSSVKWKSSTHGQAQRIWVMDGATPARRTWRLSGQRNGHYIVGTPKAQMGRFAGALTEEGWRQVREGIEVKLAQNPVAGSSIVTSCAAAERAARNSRWRSASRSGWRRVWKAGAGRRPRPPA